MERRKRDGKKEAGRDLREGRRGEKKKRFKYQRKDESMRRERSRQCNRSDVSDVNDVITFRLFFLRGNRPSIEKKTL